MPPRPDAVAELVARVGFLAQVLLRVIAMNDPLSLALLALVGLGGMALLFDHDSDDSVDTPAPVGPDDPVDPVDPLPQPDLGPVTARIAGTNGSDQMAVDYADAAELDSAQPNRDAHLLIDGGTATTASTWAPTLIPACIAANCR